MKPTLRTRRFVHQTNIYLLEYNFVDGRLDSVIHKVNYLGQVMQANLAPANWRPDTAASYYSFEKIARNKEWREVSTEVRTFTHKTGFCPDVTGVAQAINIHIFTDPKGNDWSCVEREDGSFDDWQGARHRSPNTNRYRLEDALSYVAQGDWIELVNTSCSEMQVEARFAQYKIDPWVPEVKQAPKTAENNCHGQIIKINGVDYLLQKI